MMTPGVAQEIWPRSVTEALARHERADWGEVSEEEKAANNEALASGTGPLRSLWSDRYGTSFVILTNHLRTRTTVLLPTET